jgi:hypothetical protein
MRWQRGVSPVQPKSRICKENIMEFIIGFFMGSAFKGNPAHTVLGFVLASLMLWVCGGIVWLIWNFAPQAADLIQWAGVTKFFPYLNIELQDNDWVTGSVIQTFGSRITLCAVALLLIAACFTLACYVLRGVIWAVVKAIRLMRPARDTSA